MLCKYCNETIKAQDLYVLDSKRFSYHSPCFDYVLSNLTDNGLLTNGEADRIMNEAHERAGKLSVFRKFTQTFNLRKVVTNNV